MMMSDPELDAAKAFPGKPQVQQSVTVPIPRLCGKQRWVGQGQESHYCSRPQGHDGACDGALPAPPA